MAIHSLSLGGLFVEAFAVPVSSALRPNDDDYENHNGIQLFVLSYVSRIAFSVTTIATSIGLTNNRYLTACSDLATDII